MPMLLQQERENQRKSGRSCVMPLGFWYACSSYLIVGLNLGPGNARTEAVFTARHSATRPSSLLQKRSWPRGETLHLAFSFANTPRFYPRLSKPRWPKLKLEKQIQWLLLFLNTAIPHLGGKPGVVSNNRALLLSSPLPQFPIRKSKTTSQTSIS